MSCRRCNTWPSLDSPRLGTFGTNLQWHEVKGFGVSKSGPRSEPESQLLRHWDWHHVAKLGPTASALGLSLAPLRPLGWFVADQPTWLENAHRAWECLIQRNRTLPVFPLSAAVPKLDFRLADQPPDNAAIPLPCGICREPSRHRSHIARARLLA